MNPLYEIIFGCLGLFIASKSMAFIRYKMHIFFIVTCVLNFGLLYGSSSDLGLGYILFFGLTALFFLMLGLNEVKKFELKNKE